MNNNIILERKPPLGLVPKKVAQKERFIEVCEAIVRYYNAEHEIPLEWIEEYNELLKATRNQEDK